MKKLLYTLILAATLVSPVLHAQNANRATATVVGDALNQLPAQNEALFARLMQDLIATGDQGVMILTDMLRPDGQTPASVMYALDGMVLYATRDSLPKSTLENVAQWYAHALNKVSDNEDKAFFIRQLQMLGQESSLKDVSPFLHNPVLAAPAIECVAAIGGQQAAVLLTEALAKSLANKTDAITTQLVESLAMLENPYPERTLQGMLANGPEALKPLVYYALGRCGTFAGLSYVKDGPASDYLSLLRRVADDINQKQVTKEAQSILKGAKDTKTRCDALDLILQWQQTDGMGYVLKALSDDDREYRMAALKAAAGFTNPRTNALVIKKMKRLDGEALEDVITWLGNQNDPGLASYIEPYLNHKDQGVVTAAAWAMIDSKDPQACALLTQILTGDDAFKIDLAVACLKACAGNVPLAVVEVFPQTQGKGRAAALSLLAARKSQDNESLVLAQLSSSDNTVKDAAAAALKDVATAGNRAMYFQLLENASDASIEPYRAAVWSTIEHLSAAEQFDILAAQIATLPEARQARYYPLIARTDIKKALHLVGDQLSTPEYVQMISRWNVPGAQKLIFLRKALDNAQDNASKAALLTAIGKTNTFLGIIAAGAYIDNPNKDVATAAAMTIYTTAVNNPAFYGPEVNELLKKCITVFEKENVQDGIYYTQNIQKYFADQPAEPGFVSLFNGKDLTGWQALVGNPISRQKMDAKELAAKQQEENAKAFSQWVVQDGKLVFLGRGDNLCTIEKYTNFELYVDWLLYPEGPEADAGIYLRGSPQVQIWDTSRVNVGAQVGSGGLYNNQINRSTPTHVADNKLGEWNSFFIRMDGERVTVYLNGDLVVDNVIMENYWDRSIPIFDSEAIELQAHGSKVAYRDIYLRPLPVFQPSQLTAQEKEEGFEMLFDGSSLHKWGGNLTDYVTEDGVLAVHPTDQGFGDLYTNKEYGDFIFRFEFKLTPGANNGVGIRTPGVGDAAYVGMEIQVLDHFDPIYQPWLKNYQHHGSVYGVIPAQRTDALRPVGEWNEEEIYAKGNYIRVTVNGVVVTEGDISNGPIDGQEHPGLFNKQGKIGFLGHGSELWFRNIRVKEL